MYHYLYVLHYFVSNPFYFDKVHQAMLVLLNNHFFITIKAQINEDSGISAKGLFFRNFDSFDKNRLQYIVGILK